MEVPPLIAHRLGRAYGPDNSRVALRRALNGPLGGLETDVCLTADEQLVVLHEPYLPIGTTLDGWAREREAATVCGARLLGLDGKPSDERPMLLTELLDVAPDDLPLQLEVRSYGDATLARRTAAALCETYRDHSAWKRLEVISFWPEACELVATTGLRSRLLLWSRYTPEELARWAVERGIGGVLVEHFLLSRELVETFRSVGLSVTTGTVNCAGLLACVKEFEPDAVTTDRPHELRAEALEFEE